MTHHDPSDATRPQGSPPSPRGEAAHDARPNRHSLFQKILFVEDMALFREPLSLALLSRGYRIVTASTGPEAVALVKSERPDLLLIDLGLPGMDGFAVIQQIRADTRRRDLPIVILTASADRDFVRRAKELAVQDYLLKGQCTIETLLQRINKILPPKAEAA